MYWRVNLVRTALEVSVSPDHKQALVRAHYVEKAPHTRNADGKLVFSSAHAIRRQYRFPQERYARL
jgi:hypothetical protein